MGLVKRTYALPADTVRQFEQSIPAGKRSAVIGTLMGDWLDRQRREHLRREIIEGCRDMSDLYLELEREYHPLEEEVHRALDG